MRYPGNTVRCLSGTEPEPYEGLLAALVYPRFHVGARTVSWRYPFGYPGDTVF